MSIYVDADACPVKHEIQQVARSFAIDVFLVASYAHYSPSRVGKWKYVDSTKESADLYIVNHVHTGDIVITDDYGLSSLLVPRNVYVLTSRGKTIHEGNIDTYLEQRFLAQKARNAGYRTKGPSALKKEDKQKFVERLQALLHSLIDNEWPQ
ncbi:YaiI/YqxD family protein [Litoribacterium kuwaitense]|uniref:YaiI/YqxD family protein n=1 Tax=Litoribacterium kuwaitense TaxID=1398745 RepID=UPI001BA75CB0|nr:DUF188 domain-containing protein [Litoribacterium kuwaitense]